MAGDALFIGWGAVVRGREEKSLQVFQETLEFWEQLKQEGRIESYTPYLLRPHGGGLAGFMLLTGERAMLDELNASPEFTRVIARAGAVVDDLGVVVASSGEALAQLMGQFQAASRELA